MSKKNKNNNVVTENEVEAVEQEAQDVETKEEVSKMSKVVEFGKKHWWKFLIGIVAVFAAFFGIKLGKDKKDSYDPTYGYDNSDDDMFEADCTEADTEVEDATEE